MDGRGRLRKDSPWGWQASTWQAWTFLLFGALILSNAAWFYRHRVALVEHAQATAQPAAHPGNRSNLIEVNYPTVEVHAPLEVTPLAPGERCIQGQRFATRNGELTNIGTCR